MRKLLFSILTVVAFSSCNYVNDVFISVEKQIQEKVSTLQSLLPNFESKSQHNNLLELSVPSASFSKDSSIIDHKNTDVISQFLAEKLGF